MRAGFLKALVGGDTIQARGLYKEPIEFKFYGGLQLNCNKMPDLTDCGFGMRRRLRVVPFELQFVPQPDPADPMQRSMVDLPIADVARPEHAALLKLLIDLYQTSSKAKFEPPEKVRVAADQYVDNACPVTLFKNDFLIKAHPKDDFCLAEDVFEAWKGSKEHYVPARANCTPQLVKQLKVLGLHTSSQYDKTKKDKSNTRAYWGWKLRPAPPKPAQPMQQ